MRRTSPATPPSNGPMCSHSSSASLRSAGLATPVVAPVVVGGGTRFLPEGLHLDLELFDERRFGNGFVYLGYRVRP